MKNNNSVLSPEPKVKPGEGGAIQFPNVNDVLSGRGGRINNHEGNVQFRTLVAKVKVKYLSRRTKKLDKAWIAADIVEQIRNLDPPGRFLKEDVNSGLWHEVGDERARRKTGQALREDAPEIKEEMMEIDEEYQRSNLTKLTMMSGQFPQMPYPPMYYPIAAPVYYPQVYPPAYAVPPQVMPQVPPGMLPQGASTPAAPFPPAMAPYVYPPVMYSPVPIPPLPMQPQPSPLQAQPQQHSPQLPEADSARPTKTIAEKDETKDNSQPHKITKTNANKVDLQQPKENNEEQRLMNSPPPLKLHEVHSNNSSQTDITVNSSALSENTEDMDAEFYENIQLPSVKASEEATKNNNSACNNNTSSSSKESKRSQWRNQLKQQTTSNHFLQQNQHTIDDLPSIITTSTENKNNSNIIDNDQVSKQHDQQVMTSFDDRRSSSSLPEPSYFMSSTSSESESNLDNTKKEFISTNDFLTSSHYRKSLSLTDIDVIETLATMSRR